MISSAHTPAQNITGSRMLYFRTRGVVSGPEMPTAQGTRVLRVSKHTRGDSLETDDGSALVKRERMTLRQKGSSDAVQILDSDEESLRYVPQC